MEDEDLYDGLTVDEVVEIAEVINEAEDQD